MNASTTLLLFILLVAVVAGAGLHFFIWRLRQTRFGQILLKQAALGIVIFGGVVLMIVAFLNYLLPRFGP